MLIWAEVVSYYDGMHDMSFNEVLWDFVLDILICLCVLMEEDMYISIRLICIWFEWCLVWMCLYTYIIRSCGIYVCLYDQVMMSMVFKYDWCYVLMCLYTYILRSCGISVCLYNQDIMSLIFMSRCTRILIFCEVVEYLYARITKQWGHW
jgi:hypothetical protein